MDEELGLEKLDLSLFVKDKEIRDFITNIKATRLPNSPRFNYFELNGKILIVKISRSEKPFFGVKKDYIDSLNDSKYDYFLILLVSGSEGWLYSKTEINNNIKNGTWKLREKDDNYKINYYTLKDKNLFTSTAQFLDKLLL